MSTRLANTFVILMSVLMAASGLVLGYRGDLISSVAAAALLLGGFMLFLMKHRLDDARMEANLLARRLQQTTGLRVVPARRQPSGQSQAA